MRISDWSSDVCSSDLVCEGDDAHSSADDDDHDDDEGEEALVLDDELMAAAEAQSGGRGRIEAKGRSVGGAAACGSVTVSGREGGRASGRERVGQYGWISGVAVTLKKKKTNKHD